MRGHHFVSISICLLVFVWESWRQRSTPFFQFCLLHQTATNRVKITYCFFLNLIVNDLIASREGVKLTLLALYCRGRFAWCWAWALLFILLTHSRALSCDQMTSFILRAAHAPTPPRNVRLCVLLFAAAAFCRFLSN